MHELFARRTEAGLEKLADCCLKRRQDVGEVKRRVGRLLGKNTRAEALFEVDVRPRDGGRAVLSRSKRPEREEWSRLRAQGRNPVSGRICECIL